MQIFRAPEQIIANEYPSIFLAGSIDMGQAADWQTVTEEYFAHTNFNIYNPRRKDWDNSWEQNINNPQFNEQVNWELDAMDKANHIIMNFLPASASPVTLLELGLYAKSGKLLVCCPDEYFRSGNVHIVCKRYQIPFFKKMNDLLKII